MIDPYRIIRARGVNLDNTTADDRIVHLERLRAANEYSQAPSPQIEEACLEALDQEHPNSSEQAVENALDALYFCPVCEGSGAMGDSHSRGCGACLATVKEILEYAAKKGFCPECHNKSGGCPTCASSEYEVM